MEGGSLQPIPSLLAGSYLPSFTTPHACLFPTILVPPASHAPCTLISATSRKIPLPHDSSLSLGPDELNLTSSHVASFIVCYTLVKLSYCIDLQKSTLQPFQSVPSLDFKCDSCLQDFCPLLRKKEKFITLIEAILNASHVSLSDLQ